jgi:hypothetical protein
LFISLKEWLAECYPSKVPSCCDYYDVGCIHDGETNPHLTRWNGTSWQAVERDIVILENDQRNNGDTYCTACGPDTTTPNIDTNSVPFVYRDAGVFHNTILARGFTGTEFWINGEWNRCELSTLLSTSDEESYLYGYDNSSYPDYTLVHIFNKNLRFYYWKIIDNSLNTIITSSLKDSVHGPEFKNELLEKGPEIKKLERHDLLNGNDVDVCNDSWTKNGSLISGNFSILKWIRYEVETDWSGVNIFPNSPGYTNQIGFDGTYFYEYSDDLNGWTRVEAETDWTDETYIYPDSDPNYFKVIYRDLYLYIYIEFLPDYKQWIRISCEESWDASSTIIIPDVDNQINVSKLIPSSSSPMHSIFTQNGISTYTYVSVSDTTNSNEVVCGDVLPILETYRGLWELYKKPGELWCSSHKIWDELSLGAIINFKDTIKDFNSWKYNTLQGFEPGYDQEITWGDLESTVITWYDLQIISTDSIPATTQEEWDGLRSNNLTTYTYWYNIVNTRENMFNWPHFSFDVTKESDIDYWFNYDKLYNIRMSNLVEDYYEIEEDISIYVYEYLVSSSSSSTPEVSSSSSISEDLPEVSSSSSISEVSSSSSAPIVLEDWYEYSLNLNDLYLYGIHYDPVTKKVMFANYEDSVSSRIYSMNIDGSNLIEVIVDTDWSNLYTSEILNYDGTYYYAYTYQTGSGDLVSLTRTTNGSSYETLTEIDINISQYATKRFMISSNYLYVLFWDGVYTKLVKTQFNGTGWTALDLVDYYLDEENNPEDMMSPSVADEPNSDYCYVLINSHSEQKVLKINKTTMAIDSEINLNDGYLLGIAVWYASNLQCSNDGHLYYTSEYVDLDTFDITDRKIRSYNLSTGEKNSFGTIGNGTNQFGALYMSNNDDDGLLHISDYINGRLIYIKKSLLIGGEI